MVRDLQKKFIAIAMISVTLVLLILGVSINVLNFISTNADLNSTLEMIYENQGTVPPFSKGSKPRSMHKDRFTPETPYSTRYFVLKYGADGVLHSADMKQIAAVMETDAEKYLLIAGKHGEGFGFTENYKFYIVKTDSDKYMAIFLDCYDELHALKTFALLSVSVILCGIIFVFLLVVILSKRAIMPTIRAIEKQKQFITDAGHELKTPITVINTSLKVLEMDTGQNKWTAKIRGQTDKLTRLVNDLVTLSRMDEEVPPLHFSEFDISGTVSEVLDSFREAAQAEGHFLEMEVTDGLYYNGDEAAIRQLVSILLDNALKYSPVGEKIRVSLTKNRKNIVLYTENVSAVPLKQADTEKLFDRFYRGDKSRSSQVSGFGIGLSIAKSIVEAHHGSIKAVTEESVIRFMIYLH